MSGKEVKIIKANTFIVLLPMLYSVSAIYDGILVWTACSSFVSDLRSRKSVASYDRTVVMISLQHQSHLNNRITSSFLSPSSISMCCGGKRPFAVVY